MPLPPPDAPRTRVHTRHITLEGWRREDGLWDMEARLVDLKDHDYPLASGVRPQGEPIHDISVRVTIDRQMTIQRAVVCADAVPYPGGCDTIGPAYEQLVGLNLFRGFRRAVNDLFDTVRGCSHATELLYSLPTAAVQTFASEIRDTEGATSDTKPFQLDQCHALETTSETVRRYYPRWFRSKKTGT